MTGEVSTSGGSTSRFAAVTFALIGLTISIYLAIEHYQDAATLACPDTGLVNCLKVTTSKWSMIAGLPVAVLGSGFFAVMTVLLVLPATRTVLVLRLTGVCAGTATVLYLLYVELFEVDAICLWCTGVHICTLALFVTVLWNTLGTRRPG